MDANKALKAKVRSLKDKIKDKKRKHAKKTDELYDRIDQMIDDKEMEKRKHAKKTNELYDRIDQLLKEKAALEMEVSRANTQARRAENAAKAISRQKGDMHERLIHAHNDSLFLRRKLDDMSVECQKLRTENAEHTAFRRDLSSAIEDSLNRLL